VKDEPWRGNPAERCKHLEGKLSRQAARITQLEAHLAEAVKERDAWRECMNPILDAGPKIVCLQARVRELEREQAACLAAAEGKAVTFEQPHPKLLTWVAAARATMAKQGAELQAERTEAVKITEARAVELFVEWSKGCTNTHLDELPPYTCTDCTEAFARAMLDVVYPPGHKLSPAEAVHGFMSYLLAQSGGEVKKAWFGGVKVFDVDDTQPAAAKFCKANDLGEVRDDFAEALRFPE